MKKPSTIQSIVHCIRIYDPTKNIDIAITDNTDSISIGQLTYNGMQHILPPIIVECVNNTRTAYHITLSQQQLKCLSKIHDLDILIGAKISFAKYDTLNQSELFKHNSTIDSIKYIEDQIIIAVSSIFSPIHITRTYSPFCRADFCDKACGLKRENHSASACITSLISPNIIKINQMVEGFDVLEIYGRKPIAINHIANDEIHLSANNYAFKIGDEILLKRTCDKQIGTCSDRFNNAINFRGEAYINDTISFVLTQ